MFTRKQRWMAGIGAIGLLSAAFLTSASQPVSTQDVTDFGRTRWRTHYSPAEPQYPRATDARPVFDVPLGLSRSQPLVVARDYNRDGTPETRIFHIAGDRLWALNGDMTPKARQAGQSVESYRQQLAAEGFILWNTPSGSLCTPALTARDDLLAIKCGRLGPRRESRPFASSQAAYWKGSRPQDDLIYVGFGHPASVVAIRVIDGKVLGGYIVDAGSDRGIVGAPLVFAGDTVVIGTTSGEAYIINGLASGTARVRGLDIGGRISFSPVPIGDSAFLLGSDARWDASLGTHGYLMAYNLAFGGAREFSARWPAAVVTPAGIPGEAGMDENTVYFADKFGKLYALRVENGELLWCRQYPGFGPCTAGGNPTPGFINNGPGVDENNVYFVFRNNQGPNQGTGLVVAINKATGHLVWQRAMQFKGNTAPVVLDDIVIVGDTGGYVRALDKATGQPVALGGYPLELSDEPYREGTQGERWWEPIGGTATQMTVAAGMMLMGVNSVSEERTVLKAFKLYRLPDLTLQYLDVPGAAGADGFQAKVRAVCRSCGDPITTTVSLRINGMQMPRQPVTFRAENGWAANLSWFTGPLPAGARIELIATVDPDNAVAEADETNNSLRATVFIPVPSGDQNGDHYGSRLTE